MSSPPQRLSAIAERALDFDRQTALQQLPRSVQPAFAALWLLDLAMADVIATSSQPALGAIRLAWWRDAADEINWRRFFDVNGLAGVRVELPEVFEATHATVFRLYAEGLIDGVRIDHVDGLANPRDYCRKLRRRLDALTAARPPDLRAEPAVIWVEKIIASHERLASDWLTDGTTGYDYMNEVGAVLHDPAGEAPLTELWTGLTGRPAEFEEEAQAARRQILRDNLSSELFATANAVHRIARRDLSTRDYTLTAVRQVLVELLVHFRVYRIYAGQAGISETDQRVMDWAMAGARRSIRTTDRPLLELVAKWLSGDGLRQAPAGTRRQEWQRAMVRFQQLSSPTAAKSVEDTAFYRYGRLLSRNEVGSEPSQFAMSPAAFHAAAKDRRKRFPRALLTTATHDHKRGEDTRARLAVLSEVPDEWSAALSRWTRLNAPLKRDLDGPAPDAADEIMLYQTIVGAWPLDLLPTDREGLSAFEARVAAWLQKALREAKRRTGWAVPDADYEAASRAFLAALLDPDRTAHIVDELAAFAGRLAVPGALNGLTQTLLRLTGPGVPDLYQGTEYWDFSLVDPDNRRPVDFGARQASLAAGGTARDLFAHWRDGRIKQAIAARTLALHERSPGLFTLGAYVPLRIDGPLADHVVAYARVLEGRTVIAAGSRLAAKLPGTADAPLVRPASWLDTAVVLPRTLMGRRAADVFSENRTSDTNGRLPVATLFATLPVALLEIQ